MLGISAIAALGEKEARPLLCFARQKCHRKARLSAEIIAYHAAFLCSSIGAAAAADAGMHFSSSFGLQTHFIFRHGMAWATFYLYLGLWAA